MTLSPNWREEVSREALTWLNTPYVPKARLKGVGTDCGGILYEVYNPFFGPFPPFPTDYSPDWGTHEENERYLSFIMPFVDEVRVVQQGGFSLFHVGRNWSHAAIYLGNGKYIHAWGRVRDGAVTITPSRVLHHLSGAHRPRHFEPRV